LPAPKGARLWDADGNEYLDFMCGYGPNLLGYAASEKSMRPRASRQLGDAMTGPSSVMVEFAEKFVAQISHADWAMFCKNGTDATTMA
jgi:glutamate-1-semialdehyde 2,1-aminomutase